MHTIILLEFTIWILRIHFCRQVTEVKKFGMFFSVFQDFSISPLLIFEARLFTVVRSALCIVGYLATSLDSTH